MTVSSYDLLQLLEGEIKIIHFNQIMEMLFCKNVGGKLSDFPAFQTLQSSRGTGKDFIFLKGGSFLWIKTHLVLKQSPKFQHFFFFLHVLK